LLHVGKPVRESDTRFVPRWQAYSSFGEFIPQFTARARARARSFSLLPCQGTRVSSVNVERRQNYLNTARRRRGEGEEERKGERERERERGKGREMRDSTEIRCERECKAEEVAKSSFVSAARIPARRRP